MDYRSHKTHSRLFLFGTVLGVLFALFWLKTAPTKAATGINQQINFQGRLLNTAGATVPDGFYNIQFKIYQDGDGQSVGNTTGSPAGTLKWTETRLNANTQGVRVFNGFMSVSLGSVNAFGGSIDWNQSSLWLSMNIGNTNVSCTPFSSCSPDGEMVPMQPLTSAVYALNAMQLGGLTASSFGQLSQNQTWTGVNTYRPAADATNVFQLQKSSTGVGYITADSTNTQLVLGTASSLTGKLAFATAGGGTLTINPTSSASSFTITLPAETGTVCTTAAAGACSVAGAGYVQLAPLAVQADATNNNTIFVNKTSGTGNILELQKSGSDVFKVANNGDITLTGTVNGDTVNSTAFTFSGANPVISASTSNTGLTAQANGTGILTLNTGGAGTVNLGATNSTVINIGSSASTNTVLGATNLNTSGTAATVIGNTGSTVAIASSALNLTAAGAISGVTTLGLSGAITGATATNTINGIVINSQAVSNVTTLGLSGAITGATATNTINGLVINGGALTSVTGITSNGGYTQSGSTANTLTGATTISGNLIVTGAASVAVQKGTDFATTGTSTAASFTGSLIRLTGGSLQTIQGITGATDGRIITLINAAGQSAIIANQNVGATAAERIITGTGADISLAPDTSIELRYDTTTSRWRLVGGIGGTGVSAIGTVSGTPTANGATITGNTLNLAVADGSNAGLISTAAQTLNGVKTFNNNIIAPTSANTINGLIINAGALSGIAGFTQSTGAFAFSGGGNFSVDSAAFDVTAAGAISGVTTLGLSGAITGATTTNTINGIVINSQAVSNVTTLGLSGAITGATATNTINGIIINSQAVSNVTTLGLSGAITGATATNTINGLVINSGALTSVTGITTNGGYTQSGATANTLTGATTLSGNLIVTGAASVAVQKGTDFGTTGTSIAASFTGSLIRLTGASTQTIQGITGATDGRIITLVNAAGQAAIIANQNAGATAVERIVTGTGADISLAPDASIELRYDTTTTRWRVIGGVGGTSVTTVGAVSGTSTTNGASITGNTLNLAVADSSNAGLVSTSAQTFNGVKTFSNNIIAPTSTNTINGLIINAGALSGIAGYSQSTGAFAYSGAGNFSVDSAAFDVTAAGAISGVTTLGLSGAITGATATNTINGLVVNSGALSNITGITQTSGAHAFSGGGNFSVDSAAFDVTTAGAISGVTTLGLSGAITGATATNTINGLVINSGALTSVTGITTNGGYVQSGSTANTLTGPTTISGNLIVTGAVSVAIQKGTDYSTTGASPAAAFTGSLIRLTGASTQTIQGITGATDGRVITLVNTASQAAIIANQSASATTITERIMTGSGADLTLAPDTSIELRYDITTTRWRVVGGSGSGANASLSNLANVAINTSLLPATNNSINIGSNALTFASGYYGTNVQAPLLNTADIATASTTSAALTVRTGNSSGTGVTANSGVLTIKSGDSTNGISGAVSIDTGTAGGGNPGAITIGSTNSTAITVGNTGANTTNLIQGGSGATAIQLNQGLGGTITIGTTGSASTVNVLCGSATTCGFANNATDHSTTIGSTSGVSATTLQSGSGGLTLTGNITASGTYNSNTFTSTALTFAGANPTISPSTTNTGLTLRANGSGTLTLNTSGAGTINLGTTNSTTIGIGNSSSTNTVLGASTLTGTTNINNTGTAATTIGQGTSTSGTILIQGGVSSTFSVTNSSGSSVLSFAAPSTAGTVTYQLPNGGTGGNTYGICTTFVVCSGYAASGGANTALSNLAAVAINTSLLPASNNAINVGSTTLAFASGYFATNVQAPLLNTFDQTAGSTNSVALVLRSGNTAGATSNTGAVTLKSGDATTGNSGAITIDSGTASGTKGSISIGSANTNSVTLGNTAATTTTLIQGGTGGSAVSIQAGASGAISIGTSNANSVSIGATNNTNSLTFGQSTAGETINIANAATAATTTVNILSGVGTAGIATLNLGNNTRVTGISLGNINPAAARTIAIGNTTGTANAFVDTINIATNPTTVAGGNTVNIASGTPTGSGTNLVTIGSLANASTTVIQGGTGSNAIQLTQATGGGIIVGNANTGSTVSVQCGAGTSSSCGFANNGNDHTTTIGSNVTASATVIQSGTSGISLNGAVTTSSTINTDTLTATALTFSGANPVISASTGNTGMTLQSNGTGTLTLNSSGAGTVNVGTTNTTTIGIGNTTAATQTTIFGGTGASALSLQVGSGGTLSVGTTVQTTNLNIGNTSASTVTSISGGTGTTALNAQVGNGGSINIGTTVQTSVQNIGNTSASSTTLINGGTSGTAIQLLQGTGGTLTLGGTGAGSTVNLQCGSGTTTCNLGSNATDHTTILGGTTTASATTIQAGTSGITLAQSTALSAGKDLTFTAGSGRYIQTGFNGTTTDALAITAANLTSGAALRINTTNANTTSTNFTGSQFNTTNAQATTANTGNIFGTDFEFTQNASVVSGSVNSAAVNIAIAANSSAPSDNTVSAILNVANNDTATGNLIAATDGIKVTAGTASNILNGIEFVGTFGTNIIKSAGFLLSNAGSVTLGASGGSGTLLTNNGATLNTALVEPNQNGSNFGSAATTVDVYTYFTIPQSTASISVTVPNPTNTTAGRIIYITNTGSVSFTLLTATISAGTSATLIWSGTAWTFAGADGSSILNQNSFAQTANFQINGTGQANTSIVTPLLDVASAGTLSLGTGVASGIILGGTGITTGTILIGGSAQTGAITLGSSSGTSSILIGNGTGAVTLNEANTTVSGVTYSLAGAANTSANSISIANGASAANTTVSILSGVGTAGAGTLALGNNTRVTSISLGNIKPTAARTIAIGNTTGTANAVVDTINIATNPTTVAGGNTLHIADGTPTGSGTNLVTIGSTANASSTTIQGGTGTGVSIQAASGGTIAIGSTNANTVTVGATGNTGTLTLGQSTSGETVNIANGALASGTDTINIGTGATSSGIDVVKIGSKNSTSTTTIQGGTGATALQFQVGASGDISFLNSSSTSLLSVSTSSNIVQIGSSTSNTDTIVFALNNNNGTTTPTEIDGGMYFNNATSQFMCGENGFWVSCGVPPRDHSYDLYDEFMSGNSGTLATGAYGIGGLNWYNSLIGAPGALTYNNNSTGGNAPAASTDRPGIMDIRQTGTGNGTGQTMSLGLASMKLGTSLIDLKTAVNITGGNLTSIIGLHNETTAVTAPTTGVYWKEASNGAWNYCYANATPAETCTSTGVTATAGTWFRLEIVVVSSTEVDYYLNGTKYAATGITYNTTNNVAPAYTSWKSTGTPGTLDVYIDYFQLLGTTSTAR